jgi:hypothetical protein
MKGCAGQKGWGEGEGVRGVPRSRRILNRGKLQTQAARGPLSCLPTAGETERRRRRGINLGAGAVSGPLLWAEE